MWRLAAEHIAPGREDEMAERLCDVEARFWARTTDTQRSGTLADLLAEASRELEVDVAEAVLEEAAVRHLDVDAPRPPRSRRHRHAARLRSAGWRSGCSPTPTGRARSSSASSRDGLVELIDARLYTSELAFMKPHPSVFLAALEALGVSDPTRAVFVGDRPLDDISGQRHRDEGGAAPQPRAAVPPGRARRHHRLAPRAAPPRGHLAGRLNSPPDSAGCLLGLPLLGLELVDDLGDLDLGGLDAGAAELDELGRSLDLGGQQVDVDRVAIELVEDGLELGERFDVARPSAFMVGSRGW